MTAKATQLVSLRAFARAVGATHRAVQKAIESQRLVKCINRDAKGRVRIDLEIGRKEWRANARKLPNNGGAVEKKAAAAPLPTPDAAPPPAPAVTVVGPDESRPESLAEAQLQYTIERTIGEEMKNAQRRGELLEASAVHRKVFECFRQTRDQIMNIPDRIAAEVAAETNAIKVHARLSIEIREVLESLADSLAGAGMTGGGLGA